jgi:alanine dehydrogenase
MTISIGIRRDDKNTWEARTPLIPADAQKIAQGGKMKIIAQPSEIRIYKDDDYKNAGIAVDEEIWGSDLVIAVKEIPKKYFRENGAYLYFSHTTKGQPYNMEMLKRLVDLNCTLLDYELVTDDNNKRTIFFGAFAGNAGMVDSFHALGKRLKLEGVDSPFNNVKMTNKYSTLDKVKEELGEIGKEISKNGLDKSLSPLVIGFTGYGQVSSGAQDIAKVLPHEYVKPQDLEALFNSKEDLSDRVFLTVFKEEDLFEPIKSDRKFDLIRYYNHPEEFKPRFEDSLKYLTIAINGIFWTEKYPKIITKEGLKKLLGDKGSGRLRVLGDVSCDVNGSFETTYKSTDLDIPCFTWNPLTDENEDGCHLLGVITMAVENLPCELAREASNHFSKTLSPLLTQIEDTDWSAPRDKLKLPKELEKAIIVYQGNLEPQYKHLKDNF